MTRLPNQRRHCWPAIAALVIAALMANGCSAGSVGSAPAPSQRSIVEEADWAIFFEDGGVTGTFALHQLGGDEVIVYNGERATAGVLPASTFKIVNSLIALETGVMADVDTERPWDGVDRGPAAWNSDHSLRTGIEVSAVWLYQELAREIGAKRMGEWVDAVGYGNRDLSGPIDTFWLDGQLRISPVEQLDVLAALTADELPFAVEHQAAVREILIREQGASWVWGHKTGTAMATDPTLGWLVGYTEYDGQVWVFAMNVDLGQGGNLDAALAPDVRQEISRSILEAAGALPPNSGSS